MSSVRPGGVVRWLRPEAHGSTPASLDVKVHSADFCVFEGGRDKGIEAKLAHYHNIIDQFRNFHVITLLK